MQANRKYKRLLRTEKEHCTVDMASHRYRPYTLKRQEAFSQGFISQSRRCRLPTRSDIVDRSGLERIILRRRDNFENASWLYMKENIRHVVELDWDSSTRSPTCSELKLAPLQLQPKTGSRALPYMVFTVGQEYGSIAQILHAAFRKALRDPSSRVLLLCNDPTLAGLCLIAYLMFDNDYQLSVEEACNLIECVFPSTCFKIPMKMCTPFFSHPFTYPESG